MRHHPTHSKPATIYDVANLAGVSPSTVSRGMKGSRLIGEEARRRVMQAAKRAGYARRQIRRPRERAILTVKLVLPGHASGPKRLFYDFSELADGLRAGLAPCELNLLTDVARRGFDPFPHKKGGEIDAFVFAFHRPVARVVRAIRERGAGLVVLNRAVPGVPCVTCDNRGGMAMLAEHLAERGVRDKVVFLGYDGIDDIRSERLHGFAAAAAAAAIAFAPGSEVVNFGSPEEVRTEDVKSLLEAGARTFVCVNDVLAAVVVQALHQLRVAIPSEARVTGFDDSPVRGLVRPALTTVSMPVAELARRAGTELQATLVDRNELPSSVRLRGELLVGHTT